MSVERKNRGNNPHDSIFKDMISDKELRFEFLKTYFADIDVDWDNVSIESMHDKSQTPESNSGDVPTTIADICFKVKNKDDNDVLCIVHWEHQSTDDYFMAFRVARYQLEVLEVYMRDYRDKRNKASLPIVYSAIYYNGKKKFTGPLDIARLFKDHQKASDNIFKPRLIELNQMPDNEIIKHDKIGAFEVIFKHIFDKDMTDVFLKAVGDLSNMPEEIYKKVVKYTISNANIEKEKVIKEINKERTMGTLAEAFREEGIQQGMQQGEQIGENNQIRKSVFAMLKKRYEDEDILEISGASPSQLEALKKEFKPH